MTAASGKLFPEVDVIKRVTFSDIGRVTKFDDPAADVGGKVLEVNVPAGQTRTVDININHCCFGRRSVPPKMFSP